MTIHLDDLKGIEHRVANLVGDGLPYKQIAASIIGRRTQRPITIATVRTYVTQIAAHLPNDGRPAYRRVMFWVLEERKRVAA